jgi:hypothetical protein
MKIRNFQKNILDPQKALYCEFGVSHLSHLFLVPGPKNLYIFTSVL